MALINPDAIFGANDDRINGNILIVLPKGEIYNNDASKRVLTLDAVQGLDSNNSFNTIQMTRQVATAILALNYDSLTTAVHGLTDEQKSDYAYMRLLAIKYNLISHRFTAGTINGCYNECQRVDNGNAYLVANDLFADDNTGIAQARKAAIQAALARYLPEARMNLLNAAFTDIICLMAFMFRTRGHHWLPNYDRTYIRLWNKCVVHRTLPDINWEHITTFVLHAIPPIVLDNYYLHCARNDFCDPILKLRVTALAAGTAVYGVVALSVSDLTATFPGLLGKLDHEVDHVRQAYDEIERNRWDHSINARFYGADTDRLPERNIGALGSIIKACIQALNERHPINNSPALERIANLAPITGNVYSRAIREYIGSGEFAKTLKLT